jgi:hypothetical protein
MEISFVPNLITMSHLCEQILQTVEALSIQEQQQVLDFVEFLRAKHQQPRTLDKKARGRKMAEILEKIAVNQDITDVNPIMWQQEIRQDRLLPER